MRSENEHNDLEGTPYRELRLLEEVDRTPELSQRHLATSLGAALGVTNLLVRSLTRKGYIRVTHIGWKRWAYVMTPAGIIRKVQLTLAYIQRFLAHYRRVRELLRYDIESLALTANSRIAIYGATELAELIFLALRHQGVTNIEVCDEDFQGSHFLGLPVRPLDSLADADYAKVLIAHTAGVSDRCSELEAAGVPLERIVTPLQKATGTTPVEVQGGV